MHMPTVNITVAGDAATVIGELHKLLGHSAPVVSVAPALSSYDDQELLQETIKRFAKAGFRIEVHEQTSSADATEREWPEPIEAGTGVLPGTDTGVAIAEESAKPKRTRKSAAKPVEIPAEVTKTKEAAPDVDLLDLSGGEEDTAAALPVEGAESVDDLLDLNADAKDAPKAAEPEGDADALAEAITLVSDLYARGAQAQESLRKLRDELGLKAFGTAKPEVGKALLAGLRKIDTAYPAKKG